MARNEMLKKVYALRSKAEVKALYREWAQTYDDQLINELDYVGPKRTVGVFSAAFRDRDAPILDVGCGTGLVGELLKNDGYRVVDGLDISPEMLSVAESKGVYRSCMEADLTEELDITDESYDAIISVGTFTHSHVGPNGLDELVRITRPGGLICIAVNAQVFDVDGYPAKFSELSSSGRARLTDCVEIEYLRNERIDAKVTLLRRNDD